MKNKKLVLGILTLVIVEIIFISRCIQYGRAEEKRIEESSAVKFKLVRKVEIGEGIYPGIIFANNHFYVSYEIGHRVYVKVYDENFTPTGEKYQLTGTEGPDHAMVFADRYFYLINHLYLRKFDSNWNKIKCVSALDNLPPGVRQQLPPEGGITDMLFYYVQGSLYLGMGVGNIPLDIKKGKKPDTPDNLYIREYDEDFELKNETMLKDVGNVPSSSMILQDGTFTIVSSDRHWDDSSLIVVRYDKDWNFIDKKMISAAPEANEEFPMGFLFENGLYFVSYEHITGYLSQPITGEPIRRIDVMLKAFDSNWNLLGQIKVSDDIPESILTSFVERPHLALVKNKIYVAYDSDEAGGTKIFVKEYEIEKAHHFSYKRQANWSGKF